MTEQELVRPNTGVGKGAVAVDGAATTEPITTEAEPIAKVNLSDLPEFRNYQASTDRRFEALRGELAQAQNLANEAQQRQVEAQLADAPPEEQAAYYQQQLVETQEQQAQAQARAAEAVKIDNAASALLQKHGLSGDDPGLDWTGGQTWEGYAGLAASIAEITRLRAQELAKAQGAQVTSAAEAAKQEALQSAGVTSVNKSTGTVASTDLMAEFQAGKAKLAGTGNFSAYAQLKRKFREAGLDI